MRIAELTALLHLASPALPIGAFSYSQGLESAIEHGLIHDGDSARDWIASGLTNVLARGELPFLAHQMTRWRDHDAAALAAADEEFLASRESAELRRETQQMGWSLAQLCTQLEWGDAARLATLNAIKPLSQPTAFAFAAYAHDAATDAALAAYAFSLGRKPGRRGAKSRAAGPDRGAADHRCVARCHRYRRRKSARHFARRNQHLRAATRHSLGAPRITIFTLLPLLKTS